MQLKNIVKKSRFKQFLCRHRKRGWYLENTLFQSLNGERHYNICEDCGKVLDERFLEYEGNGFK